MPISFVPEKQDSFGFDTVLDKHVTASSPSIQQFEAPRASYNNKLSFDPTKATYFELFNGDIGEMNKKFGWSMSKHKYRQTCFMFNKEELELYKKNGFVVSERLGGASFAEQFYKIYSDDLPVFVSADSILHAWHKTYDKILEDIEVDVLFHSLEGILVSMGKYVEEVYCQAKDTVLEPCVLDADFFIAVALSLLRGTLVEGSLKQTERISKILQLVANEKSTEVDLFGRKRNIAFSLFKPRGHYATLEVLQRYFRAMTWCGTIDLRIAGDPNLVSTRELGSSVVLYTLITKDSNTMKAWSDFDNIIQKFVGITDSMTFAQLGIVLQAAKIKSVTDITKEEDLKALQAQVMSMDLGKQHICGHFYYSPNNNTEQVVLPRTFTVLGQKFTIDSWVTNNVTYDRVLDEKGNKLQRRIPTALDVAYAVFDNQHVAPELAKMMQDKSKTAVKFRDGLLYHKRLEALRSVVTNLPKDMWNSSIYFQWLATLRSLSTPSAVIDASVKGHPKKENVPLPQAACTKAWQDRVVNSQLASWTQLRHDTILYVKQSFTCSTCCEYPAGYVEPNPVFWKQFLDMAELTVNIMQNLTYPIVEVEKTESWGKWTVKNDRIKETAIKVFQRFVYILQKLHGISVRQSENKPLDKGVNTKEYTTMEAWYANMSDEKFLKTIMEESHGSGATKYAGWYPSLFYREREDSGKWDPIVADVHTDTPDNTVRDPGAVLHQGVGNVNMILVAFDRGSDIACYAGPVMSHYEFLTPHDQRKNDKEWREMLRKKQVPPPHWTKSFLVPGDNVRAAKYKHAEEGGRSELEDY